MCSKRILQSAKKRGISPAITTIFLIGIAIVGATTAGNGMLKQNEIVQKTAKLDVIDASLVKVGDTEKVYFAANIKNTGTVPFSTVSIRFIDDFGSLHSISNSAILDPGEQIGDYLIENALINRGKIYVITIHGITSTGSTFQTSETITAR